MLCCRSDIGIITHNMPGKTYNLDTNYYLLCHKQDKGKTCTKNKDRKGIKCDKIVQTKTIDFTKNVYVEE